ncbi:helix-turn-helix transcriptional regulator (plasmid) [Agrobacterium leguminum]|uniref:helix-turn-helix domain-containing protein n=1 Tax=Agrobacterium leguminum TaxID=2792015 RepID=UPI00272DB29B|nr:helix-turn-helix transcriptional regulator [Agrobacterium leguminum]WLE00520.1 helix-turn-helix transcriptional regulator [Agrobacterium leguminum]
MKVGNKASTAVDVEVGKRIRFRRKQCGLSQAAVANCLGLTFQQVQKYEIGGNRVSASKLAVIATALNVPVSYFFEGIDKPGDVQGVSFEELSGLLGRPESMDLNRAFMQIEDQNRRRAILLLVKAIADMSDQEDPRTPE